MRWHKENIGDEGKLCHPRDGEAWKHFDRSQPTFAAEPRNVRLALSTDGFNPHNQGSRPYSCWPVIVTPYNLPPWMCMDRPYMFLSLLVPGPKSPGRSLDVYLQPLIDELKILWDVGVETYDVSKKQNFQMRAALMWTISDFPAYGMLSGWSTHGKLACPYCMNHIKSFRLKHGRKPCFFDCHRKFLPLDHPYRYQRDNFTKGRIETDAPPIQLTGHELEAIVAFLPKIDFGKTKDKDKIEGFGESHNWLKRSIFWELPYWKTNLIRHNLDVMHIEKNMFDNVFNTIMDIKSKTKDNVKARLDLQNICKRRDLELKEVNGKLLKPKASYTLSKDERGIVLKWVKNLRLPDGYASNLGRCVNLEDYSMHGMKSHDCHIFMERLFPLAFRDLLPEVVWNGLTELSQFFRDLCSTTLYESDMKKMEENIVVILCKLEKIFPPAFFDSMEHLPIHLAYEARVGGPVQYRWMYPFERFLNTLKRKVKNKARVEGSIVEAYLIEETSTFCSHFFAPHVETRSRSTGRNENVIQVEPCSRLSVFNCTGRPFSPKDPMRILTPLEKDACTIYILLNCPEISKYVEDSDIKQFAYGFSSIVKRWNGYFVNGYRFHTLEYGEGKSTMNSGVCVNGSYYNDSNEDYYGELLEILELSFLGPTTNTIVMFKCKWFDNGKRGTKVHPRYKIVDINNDRSMAEDNPFVMASQCHQVYYTSYPWRKKALDRRWHAVFKVKARSTYEISDIQVEEFYQETSTMNPTHVVPDDDIVLVDIHRQAEEINPDELQSLERDLEHNFESDEFEKRSTESDDDGSDDADSSEEEDDITFNDIHAI
ncbi:hypothetical protein KSP39_PZI020469 [Platanthera zijinensis]|uniref:Transposase n=1 Tax=Platanthera zijinensis TaxID=2320716 RepID=A0AAP0B051_9ASPA